MSQLHIGKIKQFVNSNRNLFNGALFSLFSFINKGLIFFLLLVLANYIGPKEYGYLSFFSTLLTVFGFIIALSSEGYLSFSYFRDAENGISESCSSSVLITLLIGTLLLVIELIWGGKLEPYIHLDTEITCYAILISIFTIYLNLHLNILRVKEKVISFGFLTISNACLILYCPFF